jgi:hypothetical protein
MVRLPSIATFVQLANLGDDSSGGQPVSCRKRVFHLDRNRALLCSLDYV